MRRRGEINESSGQEDHASNQLAGLPDLSRHDCFLVRQQVEMMEVASGGMYEGENSYDVLGAADNKGLDEYHAAETSSLAVRCLCKSNRPWLINLTNTQTGQMLLQITRPFRFYFHEILVQTGQGATVGRVCRTFACCSRNFGVYDHTGELLLTIKSPLFSPWTFNVMHGYQQVGEIKKQFSGIAQEMFTDADNFGVQFDPALSDATKTLLLAAVFLIDFMYFEDNEPANRRGGRNPHMRINPF